MDGCAWHVIKFSSGRDEFGQITGKGKLVEILFVLVPTSVVLMGIAMWVFIRAVDSGQFDNLDRHALDIFDNDEVQNDEHVGK